MTNTRKLVLVAILSALSFVLLFVQFQLIPGASFLKLDLSVLPVLVALVLFDLKSAYAVLLLRTVLKFLLNFEGPNTWIGMPMNVVALGVFVTAFAYLWVKKPNLKNYSIAAIIGTIGLTLAMIVLNIVYAVPLYAQFANFDINKFIGLGKYIWGMVLPFNLLEGVILSVIIYPIYLACKPVLDSVK